MSQCVAFGCESGSDTSLHAFPKDERLRKIWEDACGRVHFPTEPRLCSRHFSPRSFFKRPKLDKDFYVRTLKPEAVPTIFSSRKYLRPLRCKGERTAPFFLHTPPTILIIREPGTRKSQSSVGVQCRPSKTDAATQTETIHTANESVQCPGDANCNVFKDHTYAKRILVDLNLLSKCRVSTTLETFHSEYLKYLEEDTFLI